LDSPRQRPSPDPLLGGAFFPQDHLFIVPSELVRRQLIEETLQKRRVLMGPRVISFKMLELGLLRELGHRELGQWGRLFKLCELAPRLWGPLGLPGDPDFGRILELQAQLADGLDRLRLAGASWGILRQAEPKALGEAMIALGEDYEAFLGEAGAHDSVALRRSLLKELKGGRPFAALKGVKVIHCEHSQRFSPFETDFLLALQEAVGRLEVKLSPPPYIPREGIVALRGYQSLGSVLSLAEAPEGKVRVAWADPQEPGRPGFPKDLYYVSNYLFDPDPSIGAPDPEGSLSLLSAPTLYHEAEEVGRRLKRLLLDGLAPHRLAAVVPDMGSYLPAFEDVARRFGLSLSRGRGQPLGAVAPVMALGSLLWLWDSNWELSRVVRILESPYFSFETGELPWGALLGTGIRDDRGGSGFFDFMGGAAFGKGDAGGGAGPARPFDEALGPLLRDVRRLREAGEAVKAARTWPAFEAALNGALESFRWGAKCPPGKPNGRPPGPNGRTPGLPELRERTKADGEAVRMLKNSLGGLFAALRDGPPGAPAPGLAAFRSLLSLALGQELPGEGQRSQGIHLLDYPALHGAHFDRLFLMGLNDRVFPSAKAEPSYFPEAFVASLSGVLGRRLWNSASERYQGEEETLVRALSQAKGVTLSWHTRDGSEKEILPAPLVASIVGMFPDGAIPHDKVPWPLPPGPKGIADPGELRLYAAVAAGGADKPPEAILGRAGEGAGLGFQRLAERRRALAPPPDGPPRVPEAAVRAWLGTLGKGKGGLPTVSPQLLKAHAECPRAFWLGRGFGLGGHDGEPGEEPSALELGTLLHLTLEGFLRPLAGKKGAGGADLSLGRLLGVLGESAAREAQRKLPGRAAIVEAQMDKLRHSLTGWHRRQADLGRERILGLEWAFSPEGDAPPLRLGSGDKAFLVRGKIDRIDLLGDGGILIRDYKLRRSRPYQEALGGDSPLAFPIMLYQLALARNPGSLGPLGEGGAPPRIRAVFEFIDPEGEKDFLLEAPPGDESVFTGTWEGILSGRMDYARDEESCKYCEFSIICGRYAE
jgi:hypothetical protein